MIDYVVSIYVSVIVDLVESIRTRMLITEILGKESIWYMTVETFLNKPQINAVNGSSALGKFANIMIIELVGPTYIISQPKCVSRVMARNRK